MAPTTEEEAAPAEEPAAEEPAAEAAPTEEPAAEEPAAEVDAEVQGEAEAESPAALEESLREIEAEEAAPEVTEEAAPEATEEAAPVEATEAEPTSPDAAADEAEDTSPEALAERLRQVEEEDAAAEAATEETAPETDAADAAADAEAEQTDAPQTLEERLQAEGEADAATDAEADAATDTDAATDSEADAATETDAATDTDAAAEEAAPADDAVTDEAQAEDAATEEPAAEAEANVEADANVEATAEPQDTQPSEEAVETLGNLLTEGDDAEPAAVEAGRSEGETDENAGQLIERLVTETDARSSSEEFSNQVTERSSNDDDDDDGLSDLQKFGLLALGGLAVGALLNNGDEVVANTGDRVVVQQADGTYTVLKDDDTLIRRPGSEVQTRTYNDGSTESVVLRQDGSRIVTIRDASGRVLRRTRVGQDGQEVYLINDMTPYERVDVSQLPQPRPELRLSTRDGSLRESLDRLERRDGAEADRRFSLRQVREYREVRDLAPSIDIEGVNFNTGSAAIGEAEARKLSELGNAIADLIAERPNEVVLIEGHTDAVGSAASNLALSDRRAESVALALTEYFDVPPENLVVQGYGESDLVVNTDGPSRENRRATARIITPLLEQAANR
ncbi:OmpA family protein [Cereibacter changlensis]|uniref:OmpA family protein n=1 Tax=Cereibacter changlensis TaxID=402884 RepID=UPI004033208A